MRIDKFINCCGISPGGYSHSKLAWVFPGASQPSTLFKGEIWTNYIPYIGVNVSLSTPNIAFYTHKTYKISKLREEVDFFPKIGQQFIKIVPYLSDFPQF